MNATASVSRKETRKKNKPATKVSETFWGYIVRCNSCDRPMAVFLQWVAAISGGLLVVASLGFWAMPGSLFAPELISFKMALVSLFGVFGVTLIWYASHGTKYEIQVDLAKLEIREVLRNNKGVARIQNRIPFEKIGSVFIDRTQKEKGMVRLVMRLGNSAQVIEVARDQEENLTGLRDKMGRDLLGRNAPMRTKANRGYILEGAEGVIKPKAIA